MDCSAALAVVDISVTRPYYSCNQHDPAISIYELPSGFYVYIKKQHIKRGHQCALSHCASLYYWDLWFLINSARNLSVCQVVLYLWNVSRFEKTSLNLEWIPLPILDNLKKNLTNSNISCTKTIYLQISLQDLRHLVFSINIKVKCVIRQCFDLVLLFFFLFNTNIRSTVQ